MKDLAPDILRQRLLLEGFYSTSVDDAHVARFLLSVASALGLRTYGEPIVHAPSGEGSAENQGYDGFIPLIDSGISIYVWTSRRFFAVVLFTCKAFDVAEAVAFTKDFFGAAEIEHRSF